MNIKWNLINKKLSELKEFSDNPRALTQKGLKHLEVSIKKFGIAEPLVINTNGVICGGHGRKKILEKLGIKSVDCYVPEKQLTEKEFKELNIRLNKNIAGEFDFKIFADKFDIGDLEEWGFDKDDFIKYETKIEKQIIPSQYKIITKIIIIDDIEKLRQIQPIIDKLKEEGGVTIIETAH